MSTSSLQTLGSAVPFYYEPPCCLLKAAVIIELSCISFCLTTQLSPVLFMCCVCEARLPCTCLRLCLSCVAIHIFNLLRPCVHHIPSTVTVCVWCVGVIGHGQCVCVCGTVCVCLRGWELFTLVQHSRFESGLEALLHPSLSQYMFLIYTVCFQIKLWKRPLKKTPKMDGFACVCSVN